MYIHTNRCYTVKGLELYVKYLNNHWQFGNHRKCLIRSIFLTVGIGSSFQLGYAYLSSIFTDVSVKVILYSELRLD